jgi:hypothetical protein
VHPLIESHPSERPEARQQTPTAEAIAWLDDPQPPPPPIDKQESVLRDIADAIGWSLEDMQKASAELCEYDPEKRRAQALADQSARVVRP